MDTLPVIGDQVHFPGNLVVGPCDGVVENVRRAFRLGTRVALPVTDWFARIRPDALPKPWAYGSRSSVFEARVGDLESIPQRAASVTGPRDGGAAAV
ncbi:hypothetical protein [Rhodanobacter denitrificans]|uniref:Uncharacterized protein n=1 Tax=Rhodanobacter denitrificans TaxID=666685 RepID=M4NG01_9GAMM|nr:hypothetical protein [Rhodanobacter denitrificans]AGG88992.1 hypothetical protein R2APBS1_1868 [Rhodanobacter denitrificans]UJJ53016.1 hypothetical protein LRK52_18080 [Rhodanobacter denitrificans]